MLCDMYSVIQLLFRVR